MKIDNPVYDASQIVSGRFPLARMLDMVAGSTFIGQGVGVSPIQSDLVTRVDLVIDARILPIIKTAVQTVNNSIVLVNDNHLLLAVAANDIWVIELFLLVTSPTATPDVAWAFTVPAGGSIYGVWFFNQDGVQASSYTDLTAQRTIAGVDNTTKYMQTRALYFGAGTAGNVQLQWAQAVATAEDTQVLENSFMLCHKLD